MVAAQAQTEFLTLKPVKKGEEPSAVMNSIKQDFPKGVASDLSILPSKMYGEQWSADFKEDLNGAVPNLYQVTIKEGNEMFRAAYDKSGKMLSSKTIIEKAKLPIEVTNAVSTKYPLWKIVNDREKITYTKGSLKEVYHVEINQDKMYRNLFIDNTGQVIKDEQRRHA